MIDTGRESQVLFPIISRRIGMTLLAKGFSGSSEFNSYGDTWATQSLLHQCLRVG